MIPIKKCVETRFMVYNRLKELIEHFSSDSGLNWFSIVSFQNSKHSAVHTIWFKKKTKPTNVMQYTKVNLFFVLKIIVAYMRTRPYVHKKSTTANHMCIIIHCMWMWFTSFTVKTTTLKKNRDRLNPHVSFNWDIIIML